MAEETKLDADTKKIEVLNQEIENSSKELSNLTPEIEKLKINLVQKNAEIMDVGGVEYKILK